eukprot:TRINITY_DN4028_c0_g2_i1.p1 TRINITY_DN4028_c0_g2~~TRINITY_DN4028_c0_g2_i1.p1  ORF type:complete len:636 (+),score=145.81 TRINITY_DN4028_c0_g2_i1:109-2016(+)
MGRRFSNDSSNSVSSEAKKRSSSSEPRKRKLQRPGAPTVDVSGVLAQFSTFSPRGLPSPARSVPTPSHHVLMTPQAMQTATTSRHQCGLRMAFPTAASYSPLEEDVYTYNLASGEFPAASTDTLQLQDMMQPQETNLFDLLSASLSPQAIQSGYLRGQQYKHQQQQEMLLRQQMEQMAQQQPCLAEQQHRIHRMHQQVYNGSLHLQQVADQVQMQQHAQAAVAQQAQMQTQAQVQVQAQVQAPAQTLAQTLVQTQQQVQAQPPQQQFQQAETPVVSPEERRLLGEIGSHLLNPLLNLHVGSMPVVKVQDHIKETLPEINERVIKKNYSGSFHNFIKAHSNFHIFYYSEEEIAGNNLTHCNTHEGRLHYSDMFDVKTGRPKECLKNRDQQTATWKAGLVHCVLEEVEAVIRQRPIQMKLLMAKFKEVTGEKFCAVASSNHAVRALLKKRPDRFIVLQDSTVKLSDQVTPAELEEWKQKQADKDKKGNANKKMNTKNQRKVRGAETIASSDTTYSPQSQASLYSPNHGCFDQSPDLRAFGTFPASGLPLGYDSSTSATSTPASMPNTFQAAPQFTQLYHTGHQFLGSPNVPFPQQNMVQAPAFHQKMAPMTTMPRVPPVHHHHQQQQHYQFDQFTQA